MDFLKKYKVKLIGILFFLCNSIGLPAPVLHTNWVSLFGIKSILKRKDWVILLSFFMLSLVYLIVHFLQGINLKEYLFTFFFIQVMVFSTLVAYNFIKENSLKIEGLFSTISILSFGIFISAGILYFTPLKEYLWIDHDFSIQGSVPRYKAFAYEPSFFALLMSPVFIYYFLKVIYINFKKYILKFVLVMIPCIMTLSFGFFGVLIFSTIIFLVIVLLKHKSVHKLFFYPLILSIIATGAIFSFENVISTRLNKIFSGEDTSVNGRITESYYLANNMLMEKSKIVGIGLGQIKVIGQKHIRAYYGYSKEEWPTLELPNATAETLAIYGYSGLLIRLTLQIFLFFRFRVYTNYFNLLMFLFIFIYQLMGSFITSSAELVLWCFAILPIFKEFEIVSSNRFKLI